MNVVLDRTLNAVWVFAVLCAVFTPLERLFSAREGQKIWRQSWVLDFYFFTGQYLLWNTLAVALLSWVRDTINIYGAELWLGTVSQWPLWVRVLVAFVCGDFLVYWFHRACHQFQFLWRFHAIHHSSETLDWLAAHREHPVDGILTQLCQNLPLFFFAVRLDAIGALVVFRGAWALFVHSNISLPLGPLHYLLGSPQLHHWHHRSTEQTVHNFANLAPWLDWLFHTHYLPTEPETYLLGIPDQKETTYWRMMLEPLLPTPSRSSNTVSTPEIPNLPTEPLNR